MGLFGRRSFKAVEDKIQEYRDRAELASETAAGYRDITKKLEGRGTRKTLDVLSFLGGREKPKGLWSQFFWEMERAEGDPDAEREIFGNWVKHLAHGIGGMSREDAARLLQRRLKKHIDLEGEE